MDGTVLHVCVKTHVADGMSVRDTGGTSSCAKRYRPHVSQWIWRTLSSSSRSGVFRNSSWHFARRITVYVSSVLALFLSFSKCYEMFSLSVCFSMSTLFLSVHGRKPVLASPTTASQRCDSRVMRNCWTRCTVQKKKNSISSLLCDFRSQERRDVAWITSCLCGQPTVAHTHERFIIEATEHDDDEQKAAEEIVLEDKIFEFLSLDCTTRLLAIQSLPNSQSERQRSKQGHDR